MTSADSLKVEDGALPADVAESVSRYLKDAELRIRESQKSQFVRLEEAERTFGSGAGDEGTWNADLAAFEDDCPHLDPEFWKRKWNECESEADRVAVHRGLLHFWRIERERENEAKVACLVDEERRKIEKEARNWMSVRAKAERSMRMAFGFGLGHDLGPGELGSRDLSAIERVAKMIADDPRLKKLCEMIGRVFAREGEKKETEETKELERTIRQHSERMREELVGVRLGRSVEDALPSELAMCGDPDVGILFDLKFIEGRLMDFERSGEDFVPVTVKENVKRKVNEAMGPIVACIDTSGSMSGEPETVAKAVALTLAMTARRENRRCYIIEFSTLRKAIEIGDEVGFTKLASFLSGSFCGGTDADAALKEGISVMERSEYRKADLLMVSDFEFGNQTGALSRRMTAQRKRGSRFYALAIADGTGLGGLFGSGRGLEHGAFDKAWRYDARYKSLVSLDEDPSRNSGLPNGWAMRNHSLGE